MHRLLYQAIYRILQPLMRLLLRNDIAFGEFSELAKHAYVDVAEEEFSQPEKKATTSKIAIMTGLTRKEVARLRKLPSVEMGDTSRYNRSVRVISGWRGDPQFTDSKGMPMELALHGEKSSFESLVARYSGDMPVRAMLDELKRINAAEQTDDGCVRLLTRAYIPHGDDEEKLAILGTDVGLLIDTIDNNLNPESQSLRFQRKVAYDNLPQEALPEFKKLVDADGQNLLEEFNKWLATRDRDLNPEVEGSGRMRAGVGIYYFEEPVSTEEDRGE